MISSPRRRSSPRAASLVAGACLVPALCCAHGTVVAGKATAGVTPFIAFVPLTGNGVPDLQALKFKIEPAPGTASRAVNVSYTMDYLSRRGYVDLAAGQVTLPVFGLYDGTKNHVRVELDWQDGTSDTLPVSIFAADYHDPDRHLYDRPVVVKARAPGQALGFDFFYMKSEYGSPVIVDSDGRIRWVIPTLPGSYSSTFAQGGFVEGLETSLQIWRAELDGTVSQPATLQTPDGFEFSHDVDVGKTHLLGEVDAMVGGQTQWRSTAVEFDPVTGVVDKEWNLVQILSDYMRSQGDDPSLFVRPDVDWFHMNKVFYDASDDSIVVSSRENFVMKLDYATGTIRWIFGDPTKYWFKFPSLRALSLTLQGGTLVPEGQHSTTLLPDGKLLLFNNGTQSFHMPPGEPAGGKRKFSAPVAYTIDKGARTATQAWSFLYRKSLRSPLCSSVRQLPDGSLLVDYAMTDSQTQAHLVGLDPQHKVVFDYQYENRERCNTSWNAQPIGLDALAFQ